MSMTVTSTEIIPSSSRSTHVSETRASTKFQLLGKGCCLDAQGHGVPIVRPPDGTTRTVPQCKAACQNEPTCGAFNFIDTRSGGRRTRECILLKWGVIPDGTDAIVNCRCYRSRGQGSIQAKLAKVFTTAATTSPVVTPAPEEYHPTQLSTDITSKLASTKIRLFGRGCCLDKGGGAIPKLRLIDTTLRSVSRCRSACRKDRSCGAFNFIASRSRGETVRECVLLPWEIFPESKDANNKCRCYRAERNSFVASTTPQPPPTNSTLDPAHVPSTAFVAKSSASVFTTTESTGSVTAEDAVDSKPKYQQFGIGCCVGSSGDIPMKNPPVADVTTVAQCKVACQENILCGAFNFISTRTAHGRTRSCVLLTSNIPPISTDHDESCRCFRPRTNDQPPTSTASTETLGDRASTPLPSRISGEVLLTTTATSSLSTHADQTVEDEDIAGPTRPRLGSCAPPVADPQQAPSIVFLLADDMGFADLGVYGGPYADTPNLNRLAAQGTRFTRAYVAAVVCSPSRAALMTGRYYRSINPSMQYVHERGFGSLPTITSLLKGKGYRTYHVGKWHIGPVVKNGTYGIDGIFTEGLNDGESKDAGRFAKVAEVLEECAQHKQPCFINSWGRVPHFSVNPPQFAIDRFQGLAINESRLSVTVLEKLNACGPYFSDRFLGMRKYLAEVWAMDRALGRVLQKIDDLCMTDNTLVIFSSDHGAAPVQTGDNPVSDDLRRCNMMGDPGPFRGGKHALSEGGVRVPFIARWPGRVAASRIDSVSEISFVDMLPTLAGVGGYTRQEIELLNVDGYDVSSAILSESFHPLPQRDTPLIWTLRDSNATILDGSWKLNLLDGHGVELYNVDVDPAEDNNVIESVPDVADNLEQKVARWNSNLDEPNAEWLPWKGGTDAD
eukprot:m.1005323 g.1005323  ORF g.1005323 m.1005323 type:complete len:897 (-) comp24049_c0_seq1:231-2921(-)